MSSTSSCLLYSLCFVFFYIAATRAAASTLTATASSEAASAAATTSTGSSVPPERVQSESVRIGIGVGVGIGGPLLLCAILWPFYRMNVNRRNLMKEIELSRRPTQNNGVVTMEPSSVVRLLDDFELDILGQGSRINRLYTQLVFCFPVSHISDNVKTQILDSLHNAIERLSASFPWIAGQVVNEHGKFKIKPCKDRLCTVVKDLRSDASFPDWNAMRGAGFPFTMLDESTIAPCKTLLSLDEAHSATRVFLLQVNFINGGVLLTFNAQHGSMDMTGQGEIIRLLATAIRDEPFTASELSIGNMKRKDLIPLMRKDQLEAQLDQQRSNGAVSGNNPQTSQASQPATCTWAYFSFSASAQARLKSLAMEDVSHGNFVSTDDVLSAFVWQAVTRARLKRLGRGSKLSSTLSRNVDMRRYFSIPANYPGFISNATVHESGIDSLVEKSLGSIAMDLRAALDPETLRQSLRTNATLISLGKPEKASVAASSVPELDVRLSSWAKEKCYEIDFGLGFGIGKPKAVRRPCFTEGAREGLVYFLPKRRDGEVAVAVCLRKEDLQILREDEFGTLGTYVG